MSVMSPFVSELQTSPCLLAHLAQSSVRLVLGLSQAWVRPASLAKGQGPVVRLCGIRPPNSLPNGPPGRCLVLNGRILPGHGRLGAKSSPTGRQDGVTRLTSARPVSVVTGAAGELGRAVAQRLLHRGLHVVAVDRVAAQLSRLGEDFAACNELTLVNADVASPRTASTQLNRSCA